MVMGYRHLEKEVGFTKGRGGKYKHSIDVKFEVSDDKIDGILEKNTAQDDSPKLLVFSNSDNISLITIVADGHNITVDGTDIVHGIIILLGTYYIANLQYPRCYSQFLGLIQEVGLKEEYKGTTSTGYTNWMSLIKDI